MNIQENSLTDYKCNLCRDLTFIIEDNIATPCKCREVREAENILKNSGISEAFRKKTFENFNYAFDLQTIEAFNKSTEYISNFKNTKLPSREKSILFLGQVGSGKSHLSMAIANKLMENKIGVIYMPYREAITKIKQNILDEEYYIKITNKYKNAKVLLIDDLFKGSISKSDINIMFEIINHRYFNHMPIIASSEKNFEELIEIDEAIGSRLVEMSGEYLIEFKGKRLNYRIYGNRRRG
ncbi:ATP-binding protein [Romboutsia sp.]|uniref:ATP-binding protein n=1 Tax=Romboutsia sp. TaxID=1965302 RepID=UPI003F38BCDD